VATLRAGRGVEDGLTAGAAGHNELLSGRTVRWGQTAAVILWLRDLNAMPKRSPAVATGQRRERGDAANRPATSRNPGSVEPPSHCRGRVESGKFSARRRAQMNDAPLVFEASVSQPFASGRSLPRDGSIPAFGATLRLARRWLG
jgi:hypothetical protein